MFYYALSFHQGNNFCCQSFQYISVYGCDFVFDVSNISLLHICRLKKGFTSAKAYNLEELYGKDEVLIDHSLGEEIVVVCPQFMKQVHRHVKGSSEIVFLDSSCK